MTLPVWAIRMKELQKEYEDSNGKTLHSTWGDFLFCKLRAEEKTTESLTEWKRQQLQVEAAWDPQEIANILNLPLGDDIRKAILPSIKALQEENARLVELVKRLITDTDCHFETPEVIDNLVGSEYLRENVQRGLQVRTTGERWSLYRAIVKIAIAHRMQESDLK